MKKVFPAIVLLFISFALQAQKVINDPNVEPRKLSGSFHGVSVSGGIDLYLSQGDEAVAVSASKTEYRDRIRTEIENGILKVYYDGKGIRNFMGGGNTNMKVYVSYKTLSNLVASGGCDVTVDGAIAGKSLRLNITGGCDFRGKVDVDELNVEQSGGCDVDISGRASTVKVVASGGSDFNGYNLTAEVADLVASGGSDIEITANKEISANASGASDISYRGNPSVKNSHASGASSVSPKSK